MITRRTLFKILSAPFALPLVKLLPENKLAPPQTGAMSDCLCSFEPASYSIRISGVKSIGSNGQVLDGVTGQWINP